MSDKKPQGQLTIRTLAMPADTNPNGDIFGGWVVSQMDLSGASMAQLYVPRRVTTVAINSMTFISPVHVGDFVCCYADLMKIGNTSITVKVQTWAIGAHDESYRQVTEGVFVYVSIDDQGKPIPAYKKRSR